MSALLSSVGFSAAAVRTPIIVPNNLPLFQWPDYIMNDKCEVFDDIEDSFCRFEDILYSHGLNYDYNWRRLLPLCIRQGLRDWLSDFVKAAGNDAPWHTLKGAIIARYGVPKAPLRFGRIREFLACTKEEQEPIDVFLQRLMRLRAESGATDDHPVVKVFVDAIYRGSS